MTKLLLFVAIFFSSCQFFESSQKKALRIPIRSAVKTFDPAKAFNDDSLTVLAQSYEPLYEYHYLIRPLKIIPLLAVKEPHISQNGLRYTIEIKKNIRYHDHPAFSGKARYVQAQDFVNQIKRLAFSPVKSTGTWAFRDRIVGFKEFSNRVGNSLEKFWKTPIEGVKATNKNTLVFHLKQPDSDFLYLLAMNFIVPIPQEIIRYSQNYLDNEVIGTGPYVLKRWNKDEFFEFEKFVHYRTTRYPSQGDRRAHEEMLIKDAGQATPFQKSVIIKVVKENQKLIDLYLSGQLDLISLPKNVPHYATDLLDVNGNLAKKYLKSGHQLKYYPGFSYRWLGLNNQDPIWGKNKNLRQALAHAINYERLIEVLTFKTALRANSLLIPGIFGYDPKSDFKFEYDIDKAKKLLKKAGYPNGRGLPHLTYTTRNFQPISLKEGQLLKEDLSKIGIRLKIDKVEFSQFLQKSREGNLQFYTDNWILDYPSAENIYQLLISKNIPGNNKAVYRNSEVDKLYLKYVISSDKLEKLNICKKIEAIIKRDIPWIPLYYERAYFLLSPRLKNFRKSSFIRNYLKYLRVEN